VSQPQLTSVSVPKGVLSTEADGEAVLLNLENGQYHTLNEVGARMWALLAEHGQVEAVVQAMVNEYEVGVDEVRRDLMDLVKELAAQGLLKVDAA